MSLDFFFKTFVISFFLFILIQRLANNKKPLLRAFCSLILGPLSLVIVNIFGSYIGVFLPISVLSLCISTVLGIPGVIAMLTLPLFFF